MQIINSLYSIYDIKINKNKQSKAFYKEINKGTSLNRLYYSI